MKNARRNVSKNKLRRLSEVSNETAVKDCSDVYLIMSCSLQASSEGLIFKYILLVLYAI